MIIDNYKELRPFLKFEDEDQFYFLQLLQRKKDCDWLGSNSRVVKNYYINSLEYYDKIEEEVKAICKVTKARASLRLNRRSYYKTSLQTLRVITEQILNKSFKSAKNAHSTACGRYHNESDKIWIVDIDTKKSSYDVIVGCINESHNHINKSSGKNYIIKSIIETLNGYHILTNPFEVDRFKQAYYGAFKDIEIHKDNPTLLYLNFEQ